MRSPFTALLLLFTAAVFAKGAPEADTFLYQINRQSQPVSYLLGTIHIGRTNVALPDDYRRTLDKTAQLVVEFDEEAMSAAEISRMQQMMTGTQPLKTTLGAARTQRLIAALSVGEEPPPISPDSTMKPWAVWTVSQGAFAPKGYSYRHGIDSLLIQTAKQQHKPVTALEGTELFDRFAALPEAAVIRSLDSFTAHHRAFLNDIVTLERDYRRQKAKKIWAEIADPDHQLRFMPKEDRKLWHDFMYQKLLSDRNRAWLPQILRTLPQKPTLIAVGGAHLFGEDGLIELLRQAGYRVQPVSVGAY